MSKFKIFIMSMLCSASSLTLFASDGVCHRCELIRKENAKHTNPYPYYEDYLKAQEKEALIEQPKNLPKKE